ncbi:hypothetical protein ACWGDX_36495 [Streptomyces sp. NPDC055025]
MEKWTGCTLAGPAPILTGPAVAALYQTPEGRTASTRRVVTTHGTSSSCTVRSIPSASIPSASIPTGFGARWSTQTGWSRSLSLCPHPETSHAVHKAAAECPVTAKIDPLPPKSDCKRGLMNRRISQGALIVGTIGILINIVDAIGSGHLEPHDAFAALIALSAGGELLKERRPRAAKVLYAVASVLLVISGSVAGGRAWTSLFRGTTYDWLDLGLGVLVVLYVAVGAGLLLARLSGRASRSRMNASTLSE